MTWLTPEVVLAFLGIIATALGLVAWVVRFVAGRIRRSEDKFEKAMHASNVECRADLAEAYKRIQHLEDDSRRAQVELLINNSQIMKANAEALITLGRTMERLANRLDK